MITKPMYAQIVDCTTGETVVREYTEEEYAQAEIDHADYVAREAARLADEQAKAAAKQSAQDKLKDLGLTDIEIAAITGA
jgi:phage terminase Nu1 subunit (DNA packaging protein)